MSLIRKHGAVLQAWACLALVIQFCAVDRGLKSKIEFVWGKNPITPSLILPRFFTPVMHFNGKFLIPE